MVEDLWGELPNATNIRTPRAILLEQAELLTKKTQGVLVGNVGQSSGGSQFSLTLSITVPSLSYKYGVLSAQHPISLYPLIIVDHTRANMSTNCQDEAAFVTAVRAILTSDGVRRVIAGLLAQTNAPG